MGRAYSITMIKIAYIISTLENKGPVNVLFNTVKYLDKTKITPVIITLSPENSNSRYTDFKELGVEIIQMKQSRIKGLFFGVSKLKEILKRLQPEIVQANCFRSTMITGLFIKRCKRIVVIHNFPHEDYLMKFGKVKGSLMEYITTVCLKKFDRRITVSESLRNKISLKYGINSISVKNGIDTDLYNSFKQDKNEIRKELNIAENEKVFIYLDSLIKRKDPETAIEGFVSAFNSENILLVVGGGSLLDQLSEKYKTYRNIIFTGMTKEPFKYLKASDFYISSSLSESFHLSVVEAIYSGLYVIVSDIDAHREILSFNSSLGSFFEPSNVDELKNILSGLSHKNINTANCKALVENHLSAKIMAENYQNLYMKIITGIE
jgi:glycosyltransferase involved in cell wall biosynthesis